MNILFAAAEAVPFCKTGGLGDVIGSLPSALQAEGHNVSVILPLYHDISFHLREQMELLSEFNVPLGWRNQYGGLKRLRYKGINYYFVDNEYYFARCGIYGFFDEAERYAFFCRAVLQSLPYLEAKPQIIHCHDWHTGLIPLYCEAFYGHDPEYRQLRFVLTIHNLKYQGIFSKDVLGDVLGLHKGYFTPDKLEFNGDVNFLKAGIVYSNILTTVSRSYAEEIKYPYYGEGLDPLLRKYEGKLHGIVNGIDYTEYNPLTDPALKFNYRSSLTKKRQNKVKLQAELGLKEDIRVPLLSMVSRLVEQKGLDLLAHIMEEMLQMDLQLVVLGAGEEKYERMLLYFASRYPRQVSVNLGFSEYLARNIYAASDMYLMPSKFEPCGISQLIALRYGSVPIVRETGGLRDTIIPYNEYSGEGNGFGFRNFNAHELLFTIQKAVRFYHQPEVWAGIVKNCLSTDFSWKRSAREYSELYKTLAW